MSGNDGRPHVLVIGGGFAGLTFCKKFRPQHARVTLVDRQNHHLFQPLLYQVATAGLSGPDIAQPIRSILRRDERITVLMDEARDFDLDRRLVMLRKQTLSYDYLVLGTGGRTSYFGHPEWEQHAPGLKTLDDAVHIRRQVLLAFEKAETERDEALRRRLMTIVIVGGGPTGVELAGAFAELARRVLRADFRHIDPRQARVLLLEATQRILPMLPEDLAAKAVRQLERKGVEVRTGAMVRAIRPCQVDLEDEVIRAQTILWAAGVQATPLTERLGVELDKAGRIRVLPDLSIPGHPEVFALGDMVSLKDSNGRPVPGVSPAAIQMGRHAARLIADELQDGPRPAEKRPAFAYVDKGTMATIGRGAAVALMGRFKFSGFFAWLLWLGVHLVFLVGLRNRIVVFVHWTYSYLTYKRGARIITGIDPAEDRERVDSER